MNVELLEALTILEKEKNVSREIMLSAIEASLINACKSHFGATENIRVVMDYETCEYQVFMDKTVVKKVEDPNTEISLADAREINGTLGLGDIAQIPVESKAFGRIATQNAKSYILQKIKEEERKSVYQQYLEQQGQVISGIVQRKSSRNVHINMGRADALLTESEQVRGENYRQSDRIRVYVVKVEDNSKGPKIIVSRTHPELVRRLFEAEVNEVHEGIVEIKSIAREAGSRTKMAVWSNDPDVDPVGACVGVNGQRVNAVVNELRGEKIDIIEWSDNPAILIENALSPAKVIVVSADMDEMTADVIVPDYQLSLAIGKEGQNARLAARLTGYKIDIKSLTQAIEAGDLPENYAEQMYEEDAYEDGYEYDEYAYDENYEEEYYEDEPARSEAVEEAAIEEEKE